MNGTLNESTATLSSADTATTAPAPSAAPPSAPPASGAAPSSARPVDKVHAAFERAKARLAESSPTESQAPAAPKPESGDPEQAARDGASTQAAETPNDENGTSAAPEAPASTLTAPQNWDAEAKEAFEHHMDDTARAAMLNLQKNLQAGFTKGMQGIKAREQELEALVSVHEALKVEPRSALRQIAEAFGVPVYFEQSAAEPEIPDFSTPQEMAIWVSQQAAQDALSKLRDETQREISQVRAEANRDKAKAELRQEFEAAEGKYPDFRNYQAGILSALSDFPELPVESAYALAKFPDLVKAAMEGDVAKKELAELKAQQKTRSATAMRPAPGQTGEPKPNGMGKQSPGETALARAQRVIASRTNPY